MINGVGAYAVQADMPDQAAGRIRAGLRAWQLALTAAFISALVWLPTMALAITWGGTWALLLTMLGHSGSAGRVARAWMLPMAAVPPLLTFGYSGGSPLHDAALIAGRSGALTVSALALGFWLMTRFSRASRTWIAQGVGVVIGLASVAGVVGALDVWLNTGITSVLVLLIVPLTYTIIPAHVHHALIHPGSGRTLAAYWLASGVLMLFLGIGVGSVLMALSPDSSPLYGAMPRDWLVRWGVIAVGLGGLNQAAAEVCRLNRRVTGLLPFWTLNVGILSVALVRFAGGAAESALEAAGLSPDETARTLSTLETPETVGHALVIAGLGIYTLTFCLRTWRCLLRA